MVMPNLNTRDRGSYLDEGGPSQEQIERRNMIKHKLRLDLSDDESDPLANEPDYLAQISNASSTPDRSTRARRLRSMSPGLLHRKRSPAPLRRSKSNEGGHLSPGKSHSCRATRTTGSKLMRSRSSESAPSIARSSSFGSFVGFSNKRCDAEQTKRRPSRKKSDGDMPSSQQIMCLGKSYRGTLALHDAEDDVVQSEDESQHSRNPPRRNYASSPTARTAPPRRSKSVGSSVKATFNVNLGGGSKKFHSLLKSKRDKQTRSQQSMTPKAPSTPRRSLSLGRSHSGDGVPSRSSSCDASSWNRQISPSKVERRNGFVPGAPAYSRSPSTSSHRPSFPSLDKDPCDTEDTKSLDSSSFSSRPSSASSREEIFSNAIRRARERQELKHQQMDEILSSPRRTPSKSKRSSLLSGLQSANLGSPFFHRGGFQQQEHPSSTPSTTHPKWNQAGDYADDIDDIGSSDDMEEAGPSIFERGLNALEQIYDDLNV